MHDVKDPNARPDPDPETDEEAFALARRIASNAVARAVVRGEFGQGRLKAAATTLAQVLHRTAEKREGALAESIAEARRHLEIAAVVVTRGSTVFNHSLNRDELAKRARVSIVFALAALDCARALADGTLCAGCAKVARHPGEGYACAAHPHELRDRADDRDRGVEQ